MIHLEGCLEPDGAAIDMSKSSGETDVQTRQVIGGGKGTSRPIMFHFTIHLPLSACKGPINSREFRVSSLVRPPYVIPELQNLKDQHLRQRDESRAVDFLHLVKERVQKEKGDRERRSTTTVRTLERIESEMIPHSISMERRITPRISDIRKGCTIGIVHTASKRSTRHCKQAP